MPLPALPRVSTPDDGGTGVAVARPDVPAFHCRIARPCGRRAALFATLAALAPALASCRRGPERRGAPPDDERPRVFVEALFLDRPAEPRNPVPADGFNELATGADGSLVSSANLLVDEGDLGELVLPPAPGAAEGGVRSALGGLHLRARPRLVGEGGVRLELDVDLRSGEQTRPLRASFEGRLGQAFSLDTGVEAGERRLAIVVKAEAVRDPGALARLRERDVLTRDAFRPRAGRGAPSAEGR
ncbi:MAG TPA: hypothetical protein VFS43_21530 [Polyangiaceae bacterium]|nr:hypothetical protein [Polyangiaceae bacterium]